MGSGHAATDNKAGETITNGRGASPCQKRKGIDMELTKREKSLLAQVLDVLTSEPGRVSVERFRSEEAQADLWGILRKLRFEQMGL